MSATFTPTDAVDPRGVRFGAAVTSIVLAVAVAAESASLLALQTLVFAIGAFSGPRWSPYSLIFAIALRPRLGPPKEWEPARPPQFAQAVGLAFALVGTAGLALGAPTLGLVAAGLALVAALLNAATGFCLGCEMYLLIRRFTHLKTHNTEVSI
ncbi:MAG: DUF4395 domain-containing protein [Nocardioidaceae bacterium]